MTTPDLPTAWACDRFTRGQRVTLTEKGRELFGHRASHTGVVVGFGRAAPFVTVRVLRDGTKTPINYHMDFWTGAA